MDGLDASSENRELGNTLERRRAQASGSLVLNLDSRPGLYIYINLCIKIFYSLAFYDIQAANELPH